LASKLQLLVAEVLRAPLPLAALSVRLTRVKAGQTSAAVERRRGRFGFMWYFGVGVGVQRSPGLTGASRRLAQTGAVAGKEERPHTTL